MTGSNTKPVTTTIDTNSAPIAVGVDLSRVDIDAITARARQLRAAACGQLLRRTWLTISSLWRGPRRALPPSKRRVAAGTTA